MNARDISTELGISIESVEFVIHEHIQYRNISARWVPKMLNFEKKFSARLTLNTISLVEQDPL